MRISATAIDTYVYEVEKALRRYVGISETAEKLNPLWWYISSGRASSDFLHKLFDEKPFVIARILAKHRTEDDAMNAIKKKLNYVSTF